MQCWDRGRDDGKITLYCRVYEVDGVVGIRRCGAVVESSNGVEAEDAKNEDAGQDPCYSSWTLMKRRASTVWGQCNYLHDTGAEYGDQACLCLTVHLQPLDRWPAPSRVTFRERCYQAVGSTIGDHISPTYLQEKSSRLVEKLKWMPSPTH